MSGARGAPALEVGGARSALREREREESRFRTLGGRPASAQISTPKISMRCPQALLLLPLATPEGRKQKENNTINAFS